jgi:nucleoside-diphosphate-sugar epimerase
MILVTGGAGYVGSLLVRDLLSLGHSVRAIDTCWYGNPHGVHDHFELIQADLRQPQDSWLQDVAAVIHLAGFSNDPTADWAPDLNNEHNVLATRRFSDAVAAKARRDNRQIRFIFASTCSVYYVTDAKSAYGCESLTENRPVAPTSPYSRAKRLSEVDILRTGERVPEFVPIIVRKGTVFGISPRMRFDLVVNTFCLDAWRKRLITVHGQGEAWRPMLHIQDSVDTYIYMLTAPIESVRSEVFNLVYENYRVLDLAHCISEVIEEHAGVPISVKRDRAHQDGSRSYCVAGDKLAERLGLRPRRGIADAARSIWDALERGDFGTSPETASRFSNIRCLRELLAR